ncbi:hypothetical protein QTP70_028959 [Hemibagrus guttatus]|uniref:LRRNT domain-containing protein n=1 Tax=Hemibagrus guttatus TaxID=175788 RepID=A0AAE0UNJ1_9TELE|nr:hypothetical protein QTP70_028959 [Hemibagrus guttatus]KAK3536938.1 hypothetical protein QTP86_027051 [Hemibagrus guttatus]
MASSWSWMVSNQNCSTKCDCAIQWPTALYCDHKGLEQFPESLPSRTQYLFLQGNTITGFSSAAFANTTNLRWLILDQNQLLSERLDGSSLTNLTRLVNLFMNHNNLTEVPAGLPGGLKQLRLAYNQIEKIGPGAFEHLENLTLLLLQGNRLKIIGDTDFKGLTLLNLLDLSQNLLDTFPKQLPPSVRQLYLSHNALTGIAEDSLQGFNSLCYLRLRNNRLKNNGLAPGVFNVTSLVELDLSFNQLTEIPVVPTSLQYLYLEVNQIGGEILTSRTMKAELGYCSLLLLLLTIDVWGQQPRPRPRPRPKPPTTKKPPKKVLEPKEPTDFPPVIYGPPSSFSDCPRECMCPPSYPNALYCENRNLRKVPVIPSRTHYLYLQNNYIDSVTADSFNNATELKWIHLGNNRIRSIEKQVFEKLPNLLHLYAQRNLLKEIPNNLPAGLEQLRLSRNQISKIAPGAFSKMEHLALLDLHHNKISDSNLAKNLFKDLKNLIQLNLAHNILRKMPANIPNNIAQLFLDRNNIGEIPQDYFKDFRNLAFVRLNYNHLTDKGLPKMVFNISTLLDLHLAHNNLTTVPLFNSHLEHLHLNNNNIESINGTEICPFTLSEDVHDPDSVPKLRYLRLDGNHLTPPIPLDVIMCFRHLHSIVI